MIYEKGGLTIKDVFLGSTSAGTERPRIHRRAHKRRPYPLLHGYSRNTLARLYVFFHFHISSYKYYFMSKSYMSFKSVSKSYIIEYSQRIVSTCFCFWSFFSHGTSNRTSSSVAKKELITSRGDFAPRLLELLQQMLKLGWVQADPTADPGVGKTMGKPWENHGKHDGKTVGKPWETS